MANESWWDILKEAETLHERIQDMLAGETLTSEGLDEISSALRENNKTISIAKQELGIG
jgi:hypothetical protein